MSWAAADTMRSPRARTSGEVRGASLSGLYSESRDGYVCPRETMVSSSLSTEDVITSNRARSSAIPVFACVMRGSR